MSNVVKLSIYAEYADDADLDALLDAVESALCPGTHGPHDECPRWWTMVSETEADVERRGFQ